MYSNLLLDVGEESAVEIAMLNLKFGVLVVWVSLSSSA